MQNYNYNNSSAPISSCQMNTSMTLPHGPWMVVLTMTLGMASNIVALVILAKAYSRLRRRSKATFLLFASFLVATDFLGHAILGALVLSLYSTKVCSLSNPSLPDMYCQFLGGSMVFFGLCPLFLGCAMAAERCLGVTQPLLHASLVTKVRTKMVLALIWLLALTVSLLPFFSLGAYSYQHPGTWCFIRMVEPSGPSDLAFVLLFSSLGLVSLAVALVCNTISGVTLLRARLCKNTCPRRSAKSHDIEMVVQLVGIMVASCICWSPILIVGLMSVTSSYDSSTGDDQGNCFRGLLVTGVRLATWNQILDPWVYILLRRAVLRKIYCITRRHGAMVNGSTLRRWDISSFQNSEKNTVNVI